MLVKICLSVCFVQKAEKAKKQENLVKGKQKNMLFDFTLWPLLTTQGKGRDGMPTTIPAISENSVAWGIFPLPLIPFCI